ncbi:MAG TPA: c-type cytochrome biogenesis protein CcmI, partial [Aestuariivirgaceae bacterium]|nr:c-type cytochrome biogenesis protein CcmI [Aestuariivirgaceae bacterium]
WIVLAVLCIAAVLAVLIPLARTGVTVRASAEADLSVYRDQLDEVERELSRGAIEAGNAEAARTEVARRMIAAEARGRDGLDAAPNCLSARAVGWSAVAAVAAMPLVSFALYLAIGSPFLPGQPLQARLAAPVEDLDLQTLIGRIERHLADNPQDGKGWEVLAPVYLQIGRTEDAVEAWRSAIGLLGATPERLGNYGEALVTAAEGVVGIEARHVFEAALAAAPDSPLPRFYLAMAAEQDGDWRDAAARWRQLVADAPADASWRPTAVQRLAGAEQAMGGAPVATSSDVAAAPGATAGGVAAPGPTADQVAAAAEMTEAQRGDFIATMVERLEARLAADGQDLDGWLRLARSRSVMGDNGAARQALASAKRHFPDDAEAAARIEETARELGLDS